MNPRGLSETVKILLHRFKKGKNGSKGLWSKGGTGKSRRVNARGHANRRTGTRQTTH